MDAITICAANYLPFAHVLGNSFLNFNPESNFSILVVDSKKTSFEKLNKFNYLSPDDLDIPVSQFENMAFYYNVTELSTALKPSALKMLLKNGSERVVYLDPDIQVFSNFKELDDALSMHNIVLTPHNLKPMPRDDLRPTEADIMGSGVFNLGFIGISKSSVATEFLNWWETRLEFDSISDPEEMLFTDQRWIDLVPTYYPFYVLRDPGYNVAYWNLHERNLSKLNGSIFVNEKELKFFHFSGYRPEKPWILSKYVSDNPRVVISRNDVLAELCINYGKLTSDQGWKSESSILYGYENFDSGKFIPSSIRRLYREDCIAAHRQNTRLEPPADWQVWATQRTVESGNLSRILFSIWKSRPDLKRRYPDATGKEFKDFQNWARTYGVAEKVIDFDLTGIGNLKNDEYPTVVSKEFGISIAGYLKSELGLGQSARLIYQSALRTKFPVSSLNSNRSQSRQNEKINEVKSDEIFPFIVAVVNADHFEFWVNDFGKENLKNSTVIGVWAWETEDFPREMHDAFEYVDEIWAVSEFVKSAIKIHTNKPVKVFPTPIISPEIIEPLNRKAICIPENKSYNLFIFDYMSVFNRKNPLAIVQAHIDAFPNEDGPLLVIKSTNGNKDSENREKLRFSVRNRSDIILFEDYLSREQLSSLINECETYISLHRSEGYGLTMAEAMSLGKPVIATGYSGNLDFMNTNNSVLVPYSRVLIGDGSFPYKPNSVWAEPDLNFASKKLAELSKDADLRQTLGESAKKYVHENFSFVQATQFIVERASYHRSLAARLRRKTYRMKKRLGELKVKIKLVIKVIIGSNF